MSFLRTFILEGIALIGSWRRKVGLFAPVRCRWKEVGTVRGWTEYRCETCNETAFYPVGNTPLGCRRPVDDH
jgi:hypothetical protein